MSVRTRRRLAVLAALLLLAGGAGTAHALVEDDPVGVVDDDRAAPETDAAAPAPSLPAAPSAVPSTTAGAPAPSASAPGNAPAPAAAAGGAGARLTAGPIPYPGSLVDGNVKDYGAKGDGVTDDTAALQKALDDGRASKGDYYGQGKGLYLPAGTYVVSDTLKWNGCCISLIGAGSGSTTIRLKDSAAGFTAGGTPKPVLQTDFGNLAFRDYIRDLAVDTGSGNAGAVGIDYISSNQGAVRNVVIRSGDGKGHTGLAMVRDWSGPQLITDVEVDGFDTGIAEHNGQLSAVLEHVTLKNQKVVGLSTDYYLAVRDLRSINTVPAVKAPTGFLTLVDSELTGGAGGPAVDAAGDLLARGVTTSGYAVGLRYKGKDVPGATVEHSSSAVAPFGGGSATLGLPVRDTPVVEPGSSSDWTTLNWSGDLPGQVASAKSRVLVPGGVYAAGATIVVPPGVELIRAFSVGVNGAGITFVVQDGTTPLRIENFEYGVTVRHEGNRPVALVDGAYTYTSKPGAGDLYLEDTIVEPLTVQKGQHVWARQLNNEYKATAAQPKIVNNGGTLWILGLKTEQKGTVIDTRDGGSTELLGGLIYPVEQFGSNEPPAFSITDGHASLTFALQAFDPSRQYPVAVSETRSGTTKTLVGTAADGVTLYRTP